MNPLKEWLIQHRIIEIELCGWGKACHLFLSPELVCSAQIARRLCGLGEQRIHFVSHRAGNHAGSEGYQIWRWAFFSRRNVMGQFFMDGNVVEGTKVILQTLETGLIA